MPASGAFSHSSPSAVRPFSTGKAESPTAATAAVRRTTSPIAEKRLRGSVRPGSRASSARLATVSSPVYASIASGSANARSSQVGETPRSVPCVSASGETSSASAEQHEQELRRQVEPGHDETGGVELRAPHEPDGRDREDHGHRDDDVPRRVAQRLDPERRAEVVRQEDGRERDHDQVVEEERPAGEEAVDVVVGAPDERRRAAGLRERRRRLGVRERDDQEEDARAEEDERREAERIGGDDPEREVERRGDLAVGDREERRRVEHALEAAELAGHQRPPLRSSVSRPTPRAMKRPPRRKPSTPPPFAAVTASSATPIPMKVTASTATAPR